MQPSSWHHIIGQERIIREMRGILMMKKPVNILLRGRYGSGKTTIACIFAGYFSRYWVYHPTPPDPQKWIDNTDARVVDEIHLARNFEYFFPWMGRGMPAMVFCTTNSGELSPAFKSRCIQMNMQKYTEEDLVAIVMNSMARADTLIKASQALEVVKRSHRNPRIALTLAERVYRLIALDEKELNVANILDEMDWLGIDKHGYDDRHRTYLTYLSNIDGPVGISTIAHSIGIDKDTLADEIEPVLLENNKIIVTKKGRVLV